MRSLRGGSVSPPLWQNEGVYLTHDLVFQNLVYLTQLACKCSSKKGAFSLEGERKTPTLKINVNDWAEESHGGLRTVSLPHIMIRILGTATQAHQIQIRRAGRDNIPVQSQQLALDLEASSVTKNICPLLRRAINHSHDAYNRVRRHTRWKDRLGLIFLGQECFELS